MLNCCIERRRLSKVSSTNVGTLPTHLTLNKHLNYEKGSHGCSSVREKTDNLQNYEHTNCDIERLDSKEGSVDDDEEFFEAIDSQEELERVRVSEDRITNEESIPDKIGSGRREGALKQFADLQLLETGEPLFVPVTQVGHFIV